MSKKRVTVREAAELLGITPEAVRKRVERGSIEYERQQDGRVYIFLDDVPDMSPTVVDGLISEKDERIADLKEQVAYLHQQIEEEREARRRADTLLARMMDRLPELEAAEPSENQSSAGPENESDPEYPEPASETQRGFWGRIFGR